MEAAKVMIVLLASLTITSMLTSFFVTSVYGYSIIPFDISKIDYGFNYNDKESNFQANCSYAEYDTSGTVSCSPLGLYISEGYVYIKATDADNKKGVHTNTYHVIPDGGDYDVMIFQNAMGIHALSVRSDGLHLYLSNFMGLITRDLMYVPLSSANTQEAVITTTYDASTPKTTINFNGQNYELNRDLTPSLGFMGSDYWGGIATNGRLTITSMAKGYSADVNAIDGLKMIIGFFANILALVVWNIDPAILPWEINFMFIKTQALGVFICGLFLARG